MTLFPLELHTPHHFFYSEQVEAIVLTLYDGQAAVYANHAPFTAPVVPCLIKIKERNGRWRTARVAQGMLEVKIEKTILISDAAEWVQ